VDSVRFLLAYRGLAPPIPGGTVQFHTHAIVSRIPPLSQSTWASLIPDEARRLAATCETHLERRMLWAPPPSCKKNVILPSARSSGRRVANLPFLLHAGGDIAVAYPGRILDHLWYEAPTAYKMSNKHVPLEHGLERRNLAAFTPPHPHCRRHCPPRPPQHPYSGHPI
jgi:hypothetical protein